jgi:hypothetical protein
MARAWRAAAMPVGMAAVGIVEAATGEEGAAAAVAAAVVVAVVAIDQRWFQCAMTA